MDSSSSIIEIGFSDGLVMPINVWSGGTQSEHSAPVLLLHSLFFSGEMFSEVVSRFANTHTCFAPTFRGQGSVSRGVHAPTVRQLAMDILEWLAIEEVGPVHLVGSSMGGYVAMEMMRINSDCLTSLVLSCCTGEEEKDPERFAELVSYLASGPHADTGERLSKLMFGADSLSAPNAGVQQWTRRFAKTPESMAQVVECMFAHPDYKDVLSAYRGPALLIAGAQDRAKSAKDMYAIASLVPQARTVVMERVGHTPAIEDPDAFAELLKSFIDSVEARTTLEMDSDC